MFSVERAEVTCHLCEKAMPRTPIIIKRTAEQLRLSPSEHDGADVYFCGPSCYFRHVVMHKVPVTRQEIATVSTSALDAIT